MPRFRYRALSKANRLVEGVLDADSREAALQRLGRYGLILRLEELRGDFHEDRGEVRLPAWMTRVSSQSVTLFYRKFVTMISAGIPSHRAVYYLSQDEDDARMGEILLKMYRRLEAGASISHSMSEHPQAFSTLATSLVRAGEETGQLNRSLERLADFTEKSVRLRKRVLATLSYPALQVLMAVLVIGMFILFALPRMQEIFTMLGGDLPLITRLLLAAVNGVRSPWSWAGLGCVLTGLACLAALLHRDERTRIWLDERLLRLPLVGPLFHKLAVSRMLDALAMALQAGIPIGIQLSVVGQVALNRYLAERFEVARDEMMHGKAMCEAFRESGIFPPAVVQMVRVGEESGTLDILCQRVSRFYDEEVERTLGDMAALVEPLVMGGMGLVVGFIALALGLPTIQLVQQL